jgi:hypothetical protein
MKKNIYIATLTVALFSCKTKGVMIGERTSIEVKKQFNAGNVLKGQIIEANFTVMNTGNTPLLIAEVTPSCSCTVGDYEKEPIAPGDKTVIHLKVETDKMQYGDLTKTATIVANTQPSATTLVIKANITSK